MLPRCEVHTIKLDDTDYTMNQKAYDVMTLLEQGGEVSID